MGNSAMSHVLGGANGSLYTFSCKHGCGRLVTLDDPCARGQHKCPGAPGKRSDHVRVGPPIKRFLDLPGMPRAEIVVDGEARWDTQCGAGCCDCSAFAVDDRLMPQAQCRHRSGSGVVIRMEMHDIEIYRPTVIQVWVENDG